MGVHESTENLKHKGEVANGHRNRLTAVIASDNAEVGIDLHRAFELGHRCLLVHFASRDVGVVLAFRGKAYGCQRGDVIS